MHPVEQQILAALVELDATIASMATTTPKPSLLPLFERIDQLTAQLPRGTDPNLLHFLHKKSYQKARQWLEGSGASIPRGGCDAR